MYRLYSIHTNQFTLCIGVYWTVVVHIGLHWSLFRSVFDKLLLVLLVSILLLFRIFGIEYKRSVLNTNGLYLIHTNPFGVNWTVLVQIS